MKKFILLLVVCFIGVRYAKAQYVAFPTVNCYDTELTNLHLNVVREMSQRTAIISQTVQPYRERLYQYNQEGKYRDAVEICFNVYKNMYTMYMIIEKFAIWKC
jgi:hypothetical protein